MKKILVLMLIMGMSISMTSCSNKKVKGSDSAMETVVEEEVSIDDSDFIVDDDNAEEVIEEISADEPAEEVIALDETKSEPVMEEEVIGEEVVAETNINVLEEDYIVQKGETYMWVAFKLYGDYRMWRKLQAMNGHLNGSLKTGDKIKYTPNNFMWNPKGLPHLIKKGETLGTISNDKYGTTRKWKSIWDNNREMIRKPNLIFSGFTLYYIPQERNMASEKM